MVSLCKLPSLNGDYSRWIYIIMNGKWGFNESKKMKRNLHFYELTIDMENRRWYCAKSVHTNMTLVHCVRTEFCDQEKQKGQKRQEQGDMETHPYIPFQETPHRVTGVKNWLWWGMLQNDFLQRSWKMRQLDGTMKTLPLNWILDSTSWPCLYLSESVFE